MARKGKSNRRAKGKTSRRGRPGPASGVRVERAKPEDGGWVLVHPRCARQRAEDIEEVHLMIKGGEPEVATDELRWLVDGCTEFIEAHKLLGELAVSHQQDVSLARGHFGFAYQLGLAALRRADSPTPLAYRLPANQAFFEAGKGLAWCLKELDKRKMAREVLEKLLQCDPSDPLGLQAMLDALNKGNS